MKKLINSVDNIVTEMLDGMACAYPEYIKRLEGLDVVVRANGSKGKVALVSGGGSGHEPAHGGYVGKGMLDAAVAGAVFTSPTPDQVYEAIKAADGGKGVLLIIKNYTGDVMNFEMAADLARDEGIEVEQVIVADDVAVENSTWTIGRRGIAGTIFVHKIAGACAEAGGSLQEVKRVAEKVIENIRSMGMAINACTVPAAGKPSFDLTEDEVEIGIGIHGEPGVSREPQTRLPTSSWIRSSRRASSIREMKQQSSLTAWELPRSWNCLLRTGTWIRCSRRRASRYIDPRSVIS